MIGINKECEVTSEIHATAVIDSNAIIGTNVTIGAYSVVGPNVKIANNCKIGPHVVIDGNTDIGTGTQIFQFASVGAAPQDLKFHNEPSTLVIGENNVVREFVTLQPGTEHGNMTTVIGNRNLFMANSHVAHDCVVGNNNVFANSAALAGHVTVGNNVVVGGLAGIHQFTKVGDFVMVAAGAMVGRDVPPYCIAHGDHAELVGINLIALKRNGFSEVDIKAVKRTFRLVFAHGGRLEDRLETLEPELKENQRVKLILDFVINRSKRGICNASQSFDS